ncbi:MAG: hypothetical protein JXA21_11760 [Anaerolineae bacterium]|nr:hypothetical protein [Anaerolineae bacterium]
MWPPSDGSPKPASTRRALPPAIMMILSCLVAILTPLALLSSIVVMLVLVSSLALEAYKDAFVAAGAMFVGTGLPACLIALYAMNRENSPEHPFIVRLPKSNAAKWTLILTVALYLVAIYISLPFEPSRARSCLTAGVTVLTLFQAWRARVHHDRALVLSLPFSFVVILLGTLAIIVIRAMEEQGSL